jgi:hypothetical protein
VVSFNLATLALGNVFNTSPNATGNSGRESAGAPAVDANNNPYLVTGNGTITAISVQFLVTGIVCSPGLNLFLLIHLHTLAFSLSPAHLRPFRINRLHALC